MTSVLLKFMFTHHYSATITHPHSKLSLVCRHGRACVATRGLLMLGSDSVANLIRRVQMAGHNDRSDCKPNPSCCKAALLGVLIVVLNPTSVCHRKKRVPTSLACAHVTSEF
jgi:hypothetical protein